MLETTRKRGASILIYLVFGMLIVIFVINFGSQSRGAREGCSISSGAKTMVTVGDSEYGMNTWRWAFNTRGGGSYDGRTTAALDRLIRRELLAQEAERRGMVVSDRIIDEKIKTGELYVLGEKVDGKTLYFEDGEFFNYKMLLQNVVQRFGLSIGAFKSEMRRELLALAMEQVLSSGGHASKDEAYSTWLHEELSATVDTLSFKVEDYQKKMIVTDADLDRFLADHADQVKARYDADKAQYEKTPAMVRLRRVMVKKDLDKKDADPGKKTIEAARADVIGKKKTFAEVATALDADEVTRARGGDLGWKSADAPDLPTPDLSDAAKKLTPGGEPSAVLETADAYWLLWAEAKREGDLTFDQVKREVAANLAGEVWAKEAAKRAAIAALDQGKQALAAGKMLSDVFEVAPQPSHNQPPQITPEQIEEWKQKLEDPNTSPEEKEILQQILEQIMSGQLGAIGSWSQDVPAEWQAGDGKPAEAEAPKPAPVTDDVTPTAEKLPGFGAMDKPKIVRVGPVPRERDGIADLGKNPTLVKAVWEQLGDGQLADRIFEVRSTTIGPDGREIGGGTAYVVVQLVERTQPDPAGFDKEADGIVTRLEDARGADIVHDWLSEKCNTLVAKKQIRIANDVLTTRDDKGQTRQISYGACANL